MDFSQIDTGTWIAIASAVYAAASEIIGILPIKPTGVIHGVMTIAWALLNAARSKDANS